MHAGPGAYVYTAGIRKLDERSITAYKKTTSPNEIPLLSSFPLRHPYLVPSPLFKTLLRPITLPFPMLRVCACINYTAMQTLLCRVGGCATSLGPRFYRRTSQVLHISESHSQL